jgi:hypothetical protein
MTEQQDDLLEDAAGTIYQAARLAGIIATILKDARKYEVNIENTLIIVKLFSDSAFQIVEIFSDRVIYDGDVICAEELLIAKDEMARYFDGK